MTPSERQPEGNEGMEAGMRDEHAILSRAVMALGDKLAHPQSRLDEIERALCRPLPPEERRALRAEYLDRTNPRKDAA